VLATTIACYTYVVCVFPSTIRNSHDVQEKQRREKTAWIELSESMGLSPDTYTILDIRKNQQFATIRISVATANLSFSGGTEAP
jgi:allantoicase